MKNWLVSGGDGSEHWPAMWKRRIGSALAWPIAEVKLASETRGYPCETHRNG